MAAGKSVTKLFVYCIAIHTSGIYITRFQSNSILVKQCIQHVLLIHLLILKALSCNTCKLEG